MKKCYHCNETGNKWIYSELNEYSAISCSCGHCNGTGIDTYKIYNAFQVGESIYVECPFCNELHKHKDLAIYTSPCKKGTYHIQGLKYVDYPKEKVIANDFGTYISVSCPFCRDDHYHKSDTIKTLSDCQMGVYKIVQKIETSYHSTQRINLKRLNAI